MESKWPEIKIEQSKTADCKAVDVTEEVLLESTWQHKNDVKDAMQLFANECIIAGRLHDNHKLATIKAFHRAFIGGFKDESWWNEHKKERHHLPDNMQDIDLIDVLEFISDCVMAGMARSGSVYDLEINDKKLQLAFKNTVKKLKAVVIVEKGGAE